MRWETIIILTKIILIILGTVFYTISYVVMYKSGLFIDDWKWWAITLGFAFGHAFLSVDVDDCARRSGYEKKKKI